MQGPAFLTLYNSIYAYLQIVNLDTDKDFIGFEGLSDIETKQFLKYEESWIITAPSPHTYGLDASKPIADMTIQLSAKVLTYKRKNTKLIEVLGDVGGLMEVVWSLFNIIATLITDLLYDKALVNNLFSFALDKKYIKIKKNKNQNDNNQLDVSPKIYSPKIELNNIISISNNIDKLDNKKFVVEEDLNKKYNIDNNENVKKKLKKKKSSKIKRKTASLYINNELTNKNFKEENLKEPEVNNIYNIQSNVQSNINIADMLSSNENIVNKEIEEKKRNNIGKNRQIIDRIKMNCCCIYFWFCLARKKKNIQNILLDEGMDIIAENLDIMNIFKKIYSISTIEESLKVTDHIINMSDRCKMRIHALSQAQFKG